MCRFTQWSIGVPLPARLDPVHTRFRAGCASRKGDPGAFRKRRMFDVPRGRANG
jgi:hypothetical protein